MTNINEDVGLTAEDLKQQLFQSMRSTGVLRQLKGQLRQNMINELRGIQGKRSLNKSHPQCSDLLSTTIRQKKSPSWMQQAIDNLVFLHLKQNRYQYALSLFQQESGIDAFRPSLMDSFLEHIGLSASNFDVTIDTSGSSISEDIPHSSSIRNQEKKEELTLLKIFNKLSAFNAQTSFIVNDDLPQPRQDEVPQCLGEKLRAIDEEMKLHLKSPRHDPAITVSSYSAAVRRAEEDADRRAKVAFEQWKSLELTRLKMDMSKEMKITIDRRLREVEQDYQNKRDSLLNRERSAVSRMNQQKELLEREMHEQRQTLLRELEQIRMREEALHQQEQFIQDMEIRKTRELVATNDVPPLMSQPDLASVKANLPQTFKGKEKDSIEMQKVLKELEDKSSEMQYLKSEIATLKAELSSSHVLRKNQAERENLILKSHLEQLTREIHAFKGEQQPEDLKRPNKVELNLLEEVENLKKERLQQELQRHQLENTIRDMQNALTDSNTALAALAVQHNNAAQHSSKNEPVEIQQVISNYSSPEKVDTLREYELLQTDSPRLHSALTASNNSNDSFRDLNVAPVGKLHSQKRLKELESETHELDKQYQRYLKTHYKDLVMTAKAGFKPKQDSKLSVEKQITSADHSPSTSLRESPNHTNSIKTVETSHSSAANSFSKSVPLDGEEIVRTTTAVDQLQFAAESEKNLFLPLDDLNQQSESNSTISSKTLSEKSSSFVGTVRKRDVTDQNRPSTHHDNQNDQSPSISSPRKLPSLPPLNAATSSKEEDFHESTTPVKLFHSVKGEVTDSLEESNFPNFHTTYQSDNLIDKAAFSPKSDLSVECPKTHSIPGSDPGSIVPSLQHMSEDSARNLEEESNQINEEVDDVIYTSPPDIAVKDVNAASTLNQHGDAVSDFLASGISSVSDESLSSADDDLQPMLEIESNKKDESTSFKQSHSVSGQKPPLVDEDDDSYSSEFTSNVTSTSHSNPPAQQRKNLSDFDLSDDDDISAALRWGDENRPTLDSDKDDVSTLSLPSRKLDSNKNNQQKDNVDVFETSDQQFSLDSTVSKKSYNDDADSDDSW